MAQLTIEVLGIYRLPSSPELIQAQLAHFNRDWVGQHLDEARRAAREELDGTVLVELQTRGRDGRLRLEDFTQRLDVPSEQWQAPWMHVCLTDNGAEVKTPAFTDWPPSGDLRLAFYMHLWDPSRPLETSYGPVACPPPGAMPRRLWRLLPYEPVD